MAMNVNRVEHQRSILAAMGIDVWVPKMGVPAQNYQNTLYRDVAMPEPFAAALPTEIKPSLLSPIAEAEIATQRWLEPTEVVLPPLEKPSHLQVKQQLQQTESVAQPVTALKSELSTAALLQVEAFELQAYCLSHCVLLVDATRLSAEQALLWNNIQSASIGQSAQLKWPFPLTEFQDGRGASLYVQGFVDALIQDKQLVTLGQLSHLQDQKIITLPSLQEMLDQPLLKKKLWQFMQN